MSAALTIDIDAKITEAELADDDAVSAANLGVSALTGAYATTLADGTRGIRQDAASLGINPEAVATANARTETYYAVRFTRAIPEKIGSITASYADSFIRTNATSTQPRARVHFGETHIGFSFQHGGGSTQLFCNGPTSTTPGLAVKYGEEVDMVFLFKRSATASQQFMGLFISGVCVCGAYNLASAAAINYSLRVFEFGYNAGVQWTLGGEIQVYSVADYKAEGFLVQSGSTRIIQALDPTSGFVAPGATRVESGITYTLEPQNASTGVAAGESAIVCTGTTGSSCSVVCAPDQSIGYNSEGYLTFHASQIQSAAGATISVILEGGGGIDIVEVRIRDNGGTPTIDYRTNGIGGYTTLATTGVTLANLHSIRFTQCIDGRVAVIVTDDSPPAGGAKSWSFVCNPGITQVAAQVRIARTGTYAVSTATRYGHVEIEQWPMADVYTDSWTSGDSPSAPINLVPNHIPAQIQGFKVGERIGTYGELVAGNQFRVSGNVKFGVRGRSVAEWLTVNPNLPDHVWGAVALVGVSYMNTIAQEEADIETGGATMQAVLNTTADTYVDAVERLLQNGNRVLFVCGLPPPVDVLNYSTEQAEFVKDLNAAIKTRLAALTVPPSARLHIADPYTDMLADGIDSQDEADLAWDSSDTHMAGSTQDAIVAGYILNSSYVTGVAQSRARDRSRER